MEANDYVRSEYRTRSLREILDAPVEGLLGVGEAAAGQLGAIGIRTVFDLGTSRLFGSANEILLGSVWGTGTAGVAEHVPGELIDDGQREVAGGGVGAGPVVGVG